MARGSVHVLSKTRSECGRYLVTWHDDGCIYAWERGGPDTHGISRDSGWARVDTAKGSCSRQDGEIAYVGHYFDNQIKQRARAVRVIYSVHPEVYARSMQSRGFVRCYVSPEDAKRNYAASNRKGEAPPRDALEGAGRHPGGLGALSG